MRIRSSLPIAALSLGLALSACADKAPEPAAAPAPEPVKAPEPAPEPEPEAAPVEAIAQPLPGDPVAGEAVYTKSCLACHGADGKGNGGMTGADFVKDKSRLNKTNEELIKSVSEGMQGKIAVMPAHKDLLSEDEIKNALSYVRKTYGLVAE